MEVSKTAASYCLEVFITWKTLRKVSVREGMAKMSPIGGQGFLMCGNCVGTALVENAPVEKLMLSVIPIVINQIQNVITMNSSKMQTTAIEKIMMISIVLKLIFV